MQYHRLPFQVQYQDLLHKLAEHRLDHHKFRRCRYLGRVGQFQYRLHRCRHQYWFRRCPLDRHHHRPSPQQVEVRWLMVGSKYLDHHRRQYRYLPMGQVGRHLDLLHSVGQRLLDHHTYHHHQYLDWSGRCLLQPRQYLSCRHYHHPSPQSNQVNLGWLGRNHQVAGLAYHRRRCPQESQ